MAESYDLSQHELLVSPAAGSTRLKISDKAGSISLTLDVKKEDKAAIACMSTPWIESAVRGRRGEPTDEEGRGVGANAWPVSAEIPARAASRLGIVRELERRCAAGGAHGDGDGDGARCSGRVCESGERDGELSGGRSGSEADVVRNCGERRPGDAASCGERRPGARRFWRSRAACMASLWPQYGASAARRRPENKLLDFRRRALASCASSEICARSAKE